MGWELETGLGLGCSGRGRAWGGEGWSEDHIPRRSRTPAMVSRDRAGLDVFEGLADGVASLL